MTTVADVMTTDVAAVQATTPFKRIVELLLERHVSALPVLDDDGVPIGVVSEADLLPKAEYPRGAKGVGLLDRLRHPDEVLKADARVAADLMTPYPNTIRADASLAEAARRMLHGHVKRLLVIDSQGKLIGIVSRSDLLGTFLRPDEDIKREIVEDVLERRLGLNPVWFGVSVRDGVVRITGQVETRSLAGLIADMARSVDGVVQYDDRLTWEVDDTLVVPPVPWPGP